jgi:hypothetical protein
MNIAVQELVKKRQQLVDEKIKMIAKFDNELEQIESDIILIGEGKIWEKPSTEMFDDENPDYIKMSQEEI